jgi:SAM-dependent methyltransferase
MGAMEDILRDVAAYYTGKMRDHGPTARGVDWNSTESQMLRFEQLVKVCDPATRFTINDYGCGYGALVDYLDTCDVEVRYAGYDISEAMIAQARARHKGRGRCEFFTDETHLGQADFSVASGVFNVRLGFSDDQWKTYMVHVVHRLALLSRQGFAFNALTSYSDADHLRDDLFYADPLFWFDHCKRRYSRRVSLLHDYPLYEFTIVVRL